MPKRKHLDTVSTWGNNEYGFPVRTLQEEWQDISRNAVDSITKQKPSIAVPYRGTPVKDKKQHRAYIGGTKEDARKAYWEDAPIIKAATDSIAGRYGINPDLLRNRLDMEGFTDDAIRGFNVNPALRNMYFGPNPYDYSFLDYDTGVGSGPKHFGLDDAETYINSGLANPINENYYSVGFTNEFGRETNAVDGATIKDNIGIMASLIKGFRDQAARDYPNATSQDLDNYANIYYNRGIEGARNYINSGKGSVKYTKAYGGAIKPRRSLKSGGAIHIDPANRGKFNATKERTGKTTEELTHSKNPLTRKRAIFAQNAAKWNH